MSYNRNQKLEDSGRVELPPFVEIPIRKSDRYEQYLLGLTRMDLISAKYYDDANFDWLILLANPQLANMEFDIEDGSLFRIPYPLDVALRSYEYGIESFKDLYGFI